MHKFPFIGLPRAITIMRVMTALIFVVHAAVRIITSTVAQFGSFLEDKGFGFGLLIVWLITVYEIAGGLLLAAGIFTRWLALGFMIIIGTGTVIIHAANGWFVGEHGTGGMEYSILLLAALLVIASSDKN